MKLDPSDEFHFREKIHSSSVAEIEQIVEAAKHKAETEQGSDARRIAYLEYIRLEMIIFKHKTSQADPIIFENIYTGLLYEESDKSKDDKIPLKYKAEFIFCLFCIFMNNGSYTRCHKLIKMLKTLFERNKTNQYVAYKYYLACSSANVNYVTLFYETPEEYFENINLK